MGGGGRRARTVVRRFTSAQRGTRRAERETGDQDSITTTEPTEGTPVME